MGVWLRRPDAIHRGWRHTISLGPRRFQIDDDSPVPKEIVARVVAAIKSSPDWPRHGLNEIVDEFEMADTVDDFDGALEQLYDYGDDQRVIIKWEAD